MARITSKQAQEMMDAYAKVYENKEEPAVETPVNETPGVIGDIQEESESTRIRREKIAQMRKEKEAGGLNKLVKKEAGVEGQSFKKGAEMSNPNITPSSKIANNNTSNNKTPVKTQNNQTTEKPATSSGGGSVKVDGKALMSKLKADSGDKVQSSGQPQGGTPVNKLFGRGGSDGSPAPYTGGPNAAQRANAGTQNAARPGRTVGAPQGTGRPGSMVRGQGNRQRPVKTGGIQAGKAIRGGLSRLGSLAGKAVGAARSAAGNVAGAVAGAARSAAGAVGGALANKGPIQGRASGPQRRAQQAQTRAANAAPVATRPVQGQQPAAKPVVTQQPAAKPATQLTGAQRAQQMAKKRIAAGRNTVTGELKSKPPVRKVTSVMDMEGYDTVFDDTVQFLVSEGHAKDKSEAMSIMSESEFIDAFNQELNE